MTRIDIERTELRDLAAAVRADAARNLGLLRDIENTLAWLERMTAQIHADVIFAEKANDTLGNIHDVIDPDDSLQDALEKAQHAIDELYNVLIAKRQSGRDDKRLTDDDGIEAAYTNAIAEAADLQNAINTLRWNIGEHDISLQQGEVSKPYDTNDVDRMFDDMLSS